MSAHFFLKKYEKPKAVQVQNKHMISKQLTQYKSSKTTNFEVNKKKLSFRKSYTNKQKTWVQHHK